MDEKYLQDLYNWIKGKDASYESRYSYQDFASKMQDTEYATKMHQWISTKDATFSERHPIDKFISEVGGGAQQPPAEKKNPIPTPTSEEDTMESPSESTSSELSSQTVKPKIQTQTKMPTAESDDEGVLSKIGNAALKAQAYIMLGEKKVADVTTGLLASPLKWFLDKSDDIVNAERNMLRQGGFFDDDMPDTEKPITDALRKQFSKSKRADGTPLTDEDIRLLTSKPKVLGESPLDPRVIISGVATIANKIINSSIPEKQRNAIINNLALTSNSKLPNV